MVPFGNDKLGNSKERIVALLLWFQRFLIDWSWWWDQLESKLGGDRALAETDLWCCESSSLQEVEFATCLSNRLKGWGISHFVCMWRSCQALDRSVWEVLVDNWELYLAYYPISVCLCLRACWLLAFVCCFQLLGVLWFPSGQQPPFHHSSPRSTRRRVSPLVYKQPIYLLTKTQWEKAFDCVQGGEWI